METINTSGNNATGISGSVSYSIGQVFYTYFGQQAVYNMAQGIQHVEPVVTPDPFVTPEPIITPEPIVIPEPVVASEPIVTPEPAVTEEVIVSAAPLIKVENSDPISEIFIFPNPTADFVNINMRGFEFKNRQLSYKLFDLQGRLIKQNKINQNEIQISLNNLSSSLYILQVYVDNKFLKRFKILKK